MGQHLCEHVLVGLTLSMQLSRFTNVSQNRCYKTCIMLKVRKKTTIRNRYYQIPHATKDIIWESEHEISTAHKN